MGLQNNAVYRIFTISCMVYVLTDLLFPPPCAKENCNKSGCESKHFVLTDITGADPDLLKDKYGDSVFFLETSGRAGLSPRQVCAVESFSRLHPERGVIVVFLKPLTKVEKSAALSELMRTGKNVVLATVDVDWLVEGTEIAKILAQAKNGQHPIEHTNDILRMVLIWKFGGIFVDMDVLTVKKMSDLFAQSPRNFISVESNKLVSNKFFMFSQRHSILDGFFKMMRRSKNDFSQLLLGRKILNTVVTRLLNHAPSSNRVGDARLLSPGLANPVESNSSQFWITEGVSENDLNSKLTKSSAIFMWNNLYPDTKIALNSTCPYATLAKEFCPRAFWSCRSYF